MALLFMDGFDKYGPANSNSAGVAALLTAGEWTSTSAGITIVAGLSATGAAMNVGTVGTAAKTLPGNFARLICGFRFSSALASRAWLQFNDGGTAQVSVGISTTGTFVVQNGVYGGGGSVLGTSTASITANTAHYLECDITFGNAGSYQVWVDGVSVLSGTGDTTGTANNYANAISFNTASTGSLTLDDLYLFDATGSTNNAVLLTSPRIETTFPVSDSAVQFAVGAAILGSSMPRQTGAVSMVANQFRVRPFIPPVSCTINSVSILISTGSGAINLRPIIYSDSAGAPGSLLSTGATVTGTTSGAVKTMPLTTPQALTAGTQYWIGYMNDVAVGSGMQGYDGTSVDRIATSTFASGAPGTAPATSAAATTTIWGNLSGITGNWYEAAQNPPQGNLSYVYDPTVGHEDLYGFGPLSAPPASIYAVAVKANVAKSDTGTRALSVRMKSVAADSPGSVASITPGTSYGWAASSFPVDPNTSAAWTNAALTAATAGVKIES